MDIHLSAEATAETVIRALALYVRCPFNQAGLVYAEGESDGFRLVFQLPDTADDVDRATIMGLLKDARLQDPAPAWPHVDGPAAP